MRGHGMRGRRTLGGLVAAAGLAAAALAFAPAADAHVTVAAPGVGVGASDAQIVFRVPDESAKASTVGLTVRLPLDHPIAGVLVAPLPGWTARITTSKLANPIHTDDGDITQAVSQIDWTAASGGGIAPGFFGQFTVIAGKLPDGVSSLTFKAIQRYSDGSTVSWIEQAAPGSDTQPDHPAPVLDLAPATAKTASSSGDGDTLGVIGVVVGGLGLLVGAAALVLARRGRGPAATP